MSLDPQKRELVLEIIDRLLTSDRPTSAAVVRSDIWDRDVALEELEHDRILLNTGMLSTGEFLYVPRMLAFEFSGDAKRHSYALDCAGNWLRYLQRQALQSNCLDVRLPGPSDHPSSLRFSMSHLVADFPKFVKSLSRGGAPLSSGSCYEFLYREEQPVVTVQPAIREFTDARQAWAEELDKFGIEAVPKFAKPTRHSIPLQQTRVLAPHPDFSFVKDTTIRRIVVRDYAEFVTAPTHSLKARFILAGGIIEGLLLDALMQDPVKAKNTTAARKDSRDIEEWGLSVLLDVAVELKLISPSAQSFGHAVREYRNLVHPGLERRSNLSIGDEEVEIAERVLRIVIRDRTL